MDYEQLPILGILCIYLISVFLALWFGYIQGKKDQ